VTTGVRSPRVPAEKFERLYEQSDDPWGYTTSAYERQKYAETIAALPARPLGRVLEIGCSIGVFTAQLAARCERLTAIDFSARAIAIARERLVGTPRIELAQASFPEQVPPGGWDAIVCSEVLYYLDLATFERALDWLDGQLTGGACVVAVSWRGEGREEPMSGDRAHDMLVERFAHRHTLDARRDGYRLDRFDGDAR
jgi:predicted TPR repeat methyltransferase